MNMSEENDMLHLLSQKIKGPTQAFQIFFLKLLQNSLHNL